MIGPSEFGCPFCDRITKTKQNILNHIRVHTGEKPYVCEICNRAFSARNNLKRHALSHTRATYVVKNYQ